MTDLTVYEQGPAGGAYQTFGELPTPAEVYSMDGLDGNTLVSANYSYGNGDMVIFTWQNFF
jgi:hypothetical protein